jgi:hypothetical protein
MISKLKFKILLLSVLLMPLISSGQSTSGLVPLSQYLQKNSAEDPVGKIYVLDRCIALFIMFTAEAKGVNNKEAESFTNLARKAYLDLALVQSEVLLKTFKDPDKAAKDHQELTKKLVVEYQKKVGDVADMGGDVMSDNLIGGDLNICSDLLRSVRQK